MSPFLQRPEELYIRQVRLEKERVPSPDSYPFSLPIIARLDVLPLSQVTFLVGENGSGKSTLLEAIATSWGFNPEGGSQNFSFTTRESHSHELSDALTLVKGYKRPRNGFFLRAESFFNVATEIEELDKDPWGGPKVIDHYGGKSLHEQSHGESFFSLFLHRFSGNGFYVLDEPEAALSPFRQMAFLSRLHDLAQEGAQFIIATHSPILLSYPRATIYQVSPTGLAQTSYKETEHFKLYQQFLNNPERMLHELLSPQPVDIPDTSL